MNLEMRIIREVNIEAEDFYEDAISLGDHAAFALGGSEKSSRRSQVTNLESIAESAFKTSDVFDYLKKQIARFPHWRQPFPEHPDATLGFGERLKRYLEQNLAERLKAMCARLEEEHTIVDQQTRRRIHLLLIRQFLRQMAAEYEYQVSPGTKKKEP